MVPVYNGEKHLHQCVGSILGQIYTDFELFLVDDGSTDLSGNLCDEFATRDKRITVIHQANGGPGKARNAALDLAAGQYVGFVDCDDYVDPEMFHAMVSAAEKHDADVVQCGYEQVTPKGGKLASGTPKEKIIHGRYECVLEYSLRTDLSDYVPCKIIRRRLLQDIRFPDLFASEDAFFLLQVFSVCEKVVVLNEPYYKYVQHPESLTRSPANISRFDKIKSGKLMFDYCRERFPGLACYWGLYIVLNAAKLYAATIRVPGIEPRRKQLVDDFRMFYALSKNGKALKSIGLKSVLALQLFRISPALYARLYNAFHKKSSSSLKATTFCTLFTDYRDYHFWKDPGQIPFGFSKLGYLSRIVTRKNGDYPETSKKIPVEIINRCFLFGKDISLFTYFLKNSRKIDILQLYHLHRWDSLSSAFFYKLFNPGGFVYLKLDNCHDSGNWGWEKIFDPELVPSCFDPAPRDTLKWKFKKFLIKKLIVRKIDLFSVEDEDSREYFESKYRFLRNKLFTAYNGHSIDPEAGNLAIMPFGQRENLIITIGRLGSYQKNSRNLLYGFASTANQHSWVLKLAGTAEPAFQSEIGEFFMKYPELKERVFFLGNLEKQELFDLYNSAKILLLPSVYEGFELVYSEAMYFGNAIITTPYTSVKRIVEKNKLGVLVEPGNADEIGQAVMNFIRSESETKQMADNAREFALQNLNWDHIIRGTEREINSRRTCIF